MLSHWLLSVIGLKFISLYYLVLNISSHLSYSVNTNIALIINEQASQLLTISFCFSLQNTLHFSLQNLSSFTFILQECSYTNVFEMITFNINNLKIYGG